MGEFGRFNYGGGERPDASETSENTDLQDIPEVPTGIEMEEEPAVDVEEETVDLEPVDGEQEADGNTPENDEPKPVDVDDSEILQEIPEEAPTLSRERPVAVGPEGIEKVETSKSPEHTPEVIHGRDVPPGTSRQPPQDDVPEDDEDKQPDSQSDETTAGMKTALAEDKVEEEAPQENVTMAPAAGSEAADKVQSEDTRFYYKGKPVELDLDSLEYRTESPHREFETYWNIKRAEQRAELGRQSATADNLSDAVDATLRASRLSKEDESTLEKQTREWLHLKHGHTPYTTDVYTKEDDGSTSAEKDLDGSVSINENDH